MNNNLEDIFKRHKIWLDSENDDGRQLVLENINMEILTDEQMKLLCESVLIECNFTNLHLNNKDFYHIEMHSCTFNNNIFEVIYLIKSEINDTRFTDVTINNSNFSNAEFFDCNFSNCDIKNSTFINAGVWNPVFSECNFENVDFDNAYLENVRISKTKFKNPINLKKVKKLTLNIGTDKTPQLLNTEKSIEWIETNLILK